MRVLVICGAGASSTFLVHRMTRLATDRGLDVDIRPGSLEELAEGFSGLDIVLVGNHLQGSFAEVELRASEAGAVAALLPAVSFDTSGAATALDLALAAGARNASAAPSGFASTTTARDPGSLHG